ncbi:hypothetical protein [Macrococcoides caseolyticum]|uniref:hypothetical protein n=1 Tax=Macrococcoides caseolyticum TaxID=69966 RepID=UPI001F1A1D75|nr:hypothetical protein [Macrococcus caseolyticus]MCE4957480.1 hypothetical protein [Macrococcus caseolyticus]
MKNLLFWLYIIAAIVLINVGYIYWETRVTDSKEKASVITEKKETKQTTKADKAKTSNNTEPNDKLFKNDTFQSIYNNAVKEKDAMNITIVSTPYQTADDNSTVKEAFEKETDTFIKVNEVEISNASSNLNLDDIKNTQPDLVIIDAMTLNDYYENITVEDHNTTVENIYSSLNNDNIPVVIAGTRSEINDTNFIAYQQREAEYFNNQNNFNYINQSENWSNRDNLVTSDSLLTAEGVEQWVTSITGYLFNE